MSIKFRSVYTCEFHLISYCYTTGTTHTCSIHHNRIKTDNCRNIQFLGKLTDKFHHNHRSDGNTYIVLFAFRYQILNSLCYHTFSTIRAIICSYVQITCNSFHLVFKNQKIMILGSYYNICCHTILMKPLYLRIYRSSTNTTCNEQNVLFLQCIYLF